MIRIKNVILNETAMKYLYQVDEDTIKVVLENENVNINATLNDIECNYCENATTIKVNEELKNSLLLNDLKKKSNIFVKILEKVARLFAPII